MDAVRESLLAMDDMSVSSPRNVEVRIVNRRASQRCLYQSR